MKENMILNQCKEIIKKEMESISNLLKENILILNFPKTKMRNNQQDFSIEAQNIYKTSRSYVLKHFWKLKSIRT